MKSSVAGIFGCKTSKPKTKAETRRMKNSEKNWTRLTKLALLGAFLTPLLNGCATEPISITKTVREEIPAALLSPCPKPKGAKTYEDGLKLAEARGKAIDECNKRLDDIRQWSESSSS